MNSGVYGFLGNSDPQGDEQIFDMLYTEMIMRHTPGYAYGMVVALILGALLARFGRAAICGTLLGILNAGVAFAAQLGRQFAGASRDGRRRVDATLWLL